MLVALGFMNHGIVEASLPWITDEAVKTDG